MKSRYRFKPNMTLAREGGAKPGVAGRRLSPAVGVRGRRREIPAFAGMTFGWSQGEPSPSIFKKRPKCVKTAVCHNMTFAVCIFVRARFYAGNFPYRAWHIGPFRGWRRRGCLRHHLAVESAAVLVFRGDFRIFNVL